MMKKDMNAEPTLEIASPAPEARASAEATAPVASESGIASAGDDQRPAEERIASLLQSMSTRRKVLLGIVAFCEQPQEVEAVNERVAELQEGDVSVYTPYAMCSMLEKAGALERYGSQGNVEPNRVEVDGVEFWEPAENAATSWVATKAGLAAVEAGSPQNRLNEVLRKDAGYERVFLKVLDVCNVPGGASSQEIGAAVDNDPLLQKPRRFALYFYDKLEDCDCLKWQDAWVTTELGRATAEALRARISEREVAGAETTAE